MLKKLFKISISLAILLLIAAFSVYWSLKDELPNVESLKDLRWQAPMQIYSADGELISQFGEKKRIPLTLNEIPQQLIDALLATEDDRFYHHFGVDPIGMGRAVLGRLMGQNKGGGGTITMQVARNFFLTREQTIIRKLREIFLAFHIESLLTKDEILMLYINKIELGHRAFGFGAAAQVYYGKTLPELNLAQIAVLAGLPKAPSTMNPISSPKRALDRRAIVLYRMLVSGYISDDDYQNAKNAPITAKYHGAEITLHAPYVAEMAHQKMLELYGKEQAYTSGYKVFLTVPANLQRAAQTAVVTNSINYDKRHGYRGPLENLIEKHEQEQLTLAESEPAREVTTSDSTAAEQQGQLDANEQAEVETQSSSEQDLVSALELTPEIIQNYLSTVPHYQHLYPAVVTEVLDQSAVISLKNDEQTILTWSGLQWAKAYISDEKQGDEPKTAADILSVGDVIYTEKNGDTYTLGQLPQVSSALISLSPDDGAIKAAVGGFSFKQSQFNRVTQAKRQPGSNIKPFIYSAALEQGFTLASIVNDAPINHWDRSNGTVWRPKNSPPVYNGPIRLRIALAQSKNVIAVRLLRKVGIENIVNHLASFGFAPDELPRSESLALGSASLTPLEVATGFSTFANGGFLISPYLISHIENAEGEIVYQANPQIACSSCEQEQLQKEPEEVKKESQGASQDNDFSLVSELSLSPLMQESLPPSDEVEEQVELNLAPRVISAQNAFLINEALNSAIIGSDWRHKPYWTGTGYRRARVLKRKDIAGKTGTTNESKDAWFSGYTRRLVTTSWIGFDDHRRNLGRTKTGGEAGAKSAQPSWVMFMKEALKSLPEENFDQPEGIMSVRIDKTTGKLTNRTDSSSRFEYFKVGSAPTESIAVHEQVITTKDSAPTEVDSIF